MGLGKELAAPEPTGPPTPCCSTQRGVKSLRDGPWLPSRVTPKPHWVPHGQLGLVVLLELSRCQPGVTFPWAPCPCRSWPCSGRKKGDG